MRAKVTLRGRWVWGSVSFAGLGVLAALALGGTLQGCGGGGGGCSGAVSVTWDFVPGSGGCFQGDYVVVRVDDNTMTMQYDCTAGSVVTPAVEGGVTHTVDLTLFDATNTVIDQPPAQSIFVPCGQAPATQPFDFVD